MWEIEKYLKKEEEIEFEGNPEWIGYLSYFIVGFLLIWTIIIPLIIILTIILDRLSTKYVITNKRVGKRSGIISDDFKSATFKHVTSVRVTQGLLGKFLNYGNIIIDTAGSGTDVDFVWRSLKDPVKVKNIIEDHID